MIYQRQLVLDMIPSPTRIVEHILQFLILAHISNVYALPITAISNLMELVVILDVVHKKLSMMRIVASVPQIALESVNAKLARFYN